MAELVYRLAEEADYLALVRLAAENRRDDAAAVARGQGFLTGRFDAAKFRGFDLGVLVADAGGAVAGFLCASSRQVAMERPILRAMLDACATAELRGQMIGRSRLLCYGPVCVAADWRGRGVLGGLLQALNQRAAGRFEVGVLFVDADNPHSLAAHERGLGMSRVGGFGFGGRDYVVLGFRCDAAA